MPTRSELNQIIADRRAEDPAFREQLLAGPRAALRAVVGADVPDSVTISVHEESLTDVHKVIPAAAGGSVTDAARR